MADTTTFQVTAKECPDTLEHYPDPELSKFIPQPGMPRVNHTATKEFPNGVPRPKGAPDAKERTVLQQHVDFWDENRDGIITPAETWRGFRKLGFNLFWSAIAVLFIHGTMAMSTHETWSDAFTFTIKIRNMNRGRHGSDSGIFDKEGRFIPANFENLFFTMDKDKKGGLSFNEGRAFIRHNRVGYDIYGWLAGIFEWGFLYMLAADANGIVSKESIRGQFDGSLFYKIAEQNAQLTKQKQDEASQARALKQKVAQTVAAAKQAAKEQIAHVKKEVEAAKKEL